MSCDTSLRCLSARRSSLHGFRRRSTDSKSVRHTEIAKSCARYRTTRSSRMHFGLSRTFTSFSQTIHHSCCPHGCAERSEEHTSELQSPCNLVCRLLLEKKNKQTNILLIQKIERHDTNQIT